MRRGIKPKAKVPLPYTALSATPPAILNNEEKAVYKSLVAMFEPDVDQKDIVTKVAQLQFIYNTLLNDIIDRGVMVEYPNGTKANNKSVNQLAIMTTQITRLTNDLRDEHSRREIASQTSEASKEDQEFQELCG